MRFIEPSYEILHCPEGEEVLALLELAARTCYKSEDKIDDGKEPCAHCAGTGRIYDPHANLQWSTERTCPECFGVGSRQAREPTSHRLIKQILNSQHLSVIEHVSITVKFVCNRGVSHELVRHRLASYSQESTRYCNYNKERHGGGHLNIINPSYRPQGSEDPAVSERRIIWERALTAIERAYNSLIELGEKPQQARDILPIGLKTEVVTTANLREWQHIFRMRCSPKAHPQIRELMIPLRDELRKRIPLIFDDE